MVSQVNSCPRKHRPVFLVAVDRTSITIAMMRRDQVLLRYAKIESRLRFRKGRSILDSAASQPQSGEWLLSHGLQQLELLFRAIVYQPAEPILIADNDRNYRDASCGAARLFGLPRSRIIGRRIDDFAEPNFRPHIEQLWHAFLQRGEQHGTFRLVGADGSLREVEYTAKGNVLPVRHVLALHDKSLRDKTTKHAKASEDPAWVRD